MLLLHDVRDILLFGGALLRLHVGGAEELVFRPAGAPVWAPAAGLAGG